MYIGTKLQKKGKQTMADWSSIASDVASIGIHLLGALLGESQSDAEVTYTQGHVVWTKDSNGVKAVNKGNAELGVSFAMSTLQDGNSPSSTIEYLPIPAGGSQPVTQQLSDFANGRVCISQASSAPDATDAPATLVAAVQFAIRTLALGVTVNIIQGVKMSVGQNKKNGLYELTVLTTGQPIQNMRATVTDPTGVTVTGEATFKPSDQENSSPPSYTLQLPSGVNLDPIVENLDLSLTMDNASYLRATAESRQNLVKGSPKKPRPSTVR